MSDERKTTTEERRVADLIVRYLRSFNEQNGHGPATCADAGRFADDIRLGKYNDAGHVTGEEKCDSCRMHHEQAESYRRASENWRALYDAKRDEIKAINESRRGPVTWTLHLNKYQRDNLLWLLQLVRSGALQFANTGDWTGEIPAMLVPPGAPPELLPTDTPNQSIAQWEASDMRSGYSARCFQIARLKKALADIADLAESHDDQVIKDFVDAILKREA